SASRLRPGMAKNKGEDLARKNRAEDLAQDQGGDQQEQRQRRNPFAGLKLSRSVSADRPGAQGRADETGPLANQKRPEKAEKQRRGMFNGLRLNARHGASQDRAEASADARPEKEGRTRQAPTQDRL